MRNLRNLRTLASEPPPALARQGDLWSSRAPGTRPPPGIVFRRRLVDTDYQSVQDVSASELDRDWVTVRLEVSDNKRWVVVVLAREAD